MSSLAAGEISIAANIETLLNLLIHPAYLCADNKLISG